VLQVRKPTDLLKTTAHRRTYIIVKKQMLDYWEYGNWHAIFWRHVRVSRFKPVINEADAYWNSEIPKLYYRGNWKDTTRNRRQWMKKKVIEERAIACDGYFILRKGWKSY
jgi:hypothetical protein